MDRPAITDPFLSVQDAIDAAGLLDEGCVLQLPTGSGKTFLARKACGRALAKGLRAVYLCPLRALARELAGSWAADLQLREAGIGLFTGEMGLDEEEGAARSPREVGVSIQTPEKLDAYLRAWQANLDWLAALDLLVVDEAHLLDSGRRGATLEGVIARLRAINPYVRVMALSATLGNREELGAWLSARTFHTDRRPIPLAWRIETFVAGGNAMTGKAQLVTDEVKVTKEQGGQCIVFCQSRPRTESLALMLSGAGLRADFHHAGRSRRQREAAEAAFREGALDVLVATPTLAMGVNLPARKVILHDLQRFEKGDWVDLPVNEIWQLAGRAGRRGLDSSGEVVLLAPKHNQKCARRYIEGRFEPIRSQLGKAGLLAEQVLVAVGSGHARLPQQVQRVISGTLYAHQNRQVYEKVTAHAIEAMLAAGMLESDEEGVLHATRLGRVAVRHQLSPATVCAWRQALQTLGPNLSFLDALLLVCAAGEFNARLRASDEDLPFVGEALNQDPMRLREHSLASWPQILGERDGRQIAAAAKTAVLLRAWCRLGDIEEAAELAQADAFALEEARKEAVRLIGALRMVSQTDAKQDEGEALFVEPDLSERLQALQAMVCTGLDERHATLALIEGIGPRWARRLIEAGVEDIEDLALAEVANIGRIEGVSEARAKRWIEAAGAFLGSGGAFRYRETRSAAADEIAIGDGAAGIDFHRWLRAAQLVMVRVEAGWTVMGGAEPHRVSADGSVCDCADAARGTFCKHRIAVRHALNDPAVPRFDGRFSAENPANLRDLWNGGWK